MRRLQEQTRLSDLGHLIARFFGHLFARRLDDAERQYVADHLNEAERILWWRQPVGDQRHALTAARHVSTIAPNNRSAIRAALLHDVGKRHCGLGAVGRSLATVVKILGLPRTARVRSYLDHGEIGARELEAAGAEAIVVDFARHHSVGTPPGADNELWDLLFAADRATKAPGLDSGSNTMPSP